MKRLCVFYKYANKWIGRRVDWIVCKECSAKLRRGKILKIALDKIVRLI